MGRGEGKNLSNVLTLQALLAGTVAQDRLEMPSEGLEQLDWSLGNWYTCLFLLTPFDFLPEQ